MAVGGAVALVLGLAGVPFWAALAVASLSSLSAAAPKKIRKVFLFAFRSACEKGNNAMLLKIAVAVTLFICSSFVAAQKTCTFNT